MDMHTPAAAAASGTPRRALVLSGGIALGAFEAGSSPRWRGRTSGCRTGSSVLPPAR